LNDLFLVNFAGKPGLKGTDPDLPIREKAQSDQSDREEGQHDEETNPAGPAIKTGARRGPDRQPHCKDRKDGHQGRREIHLEPLNQGKETGDPDYKDDASREPAKKAGGIG
jgi:hypothetical protein